METFPRDEFLSERWSYAAGEHVTFLGPTGSGKTMLAFQLLQVTAHPKLPAIVLAMKPRDATVKQWAKTLDYRTVKTWPPPPNLLKPQPPGYVLWPKHTFDPDRDDIILYREFRRAILHSYKRGNRILFGDELFGLTDLGLERELVTLWTRGRSMGTGLWGGTQKPSHIPLWAYNQASHIFLARDPDKRARQRYAEIGGVDPSMLEDAVMSLAKYQWVYVRRDGPAVCVVDK